MNKIPTLFGRFNDSYEQEGTILPLLDLYAQRLLGPEPFSFGGEGATVVATEKLDGTNVRVTVRNHMVMRIEKRRNPSKKQKRIGIIDPWYTDVQIDDPADEHIRRAVAHTHMDSVPDGEWCGEAIGPKIQGNPLGLETPRVVFFTLGEAPVLEDVPAYKTAEGYTAVNIEDFFYDLKKYLKTAETRMQFGTGYMEGIVWHLPDGRMVKLKRKDFGF